MASTTVLGAWFADLLEQAVGRYLALSPHSSGLLAPLAGKLIELRLEPPGQRVLLAPTEAGFTFPPADDGTPDATLIGSPLAFARMALGGKPMRGLFAGEVVVEGDVGVARRFQALFQRLDIDWEAHLAALTGYDVAAWLTGQTRATRSWWQERRESLRADVAEYLQEESRELPALTEASGFCSDVDTLRADCDRLTARIERLERGLSPARS